MDTGSTEGTVNSAIELVFEAVGMELLEALQTAANQLDRQITVTMNFTPMDDGANIEFRVHPKALTN